MLRRLSLFAVVAAMVFSPALPALAADEIVVYSARKEELIKPIFERFTTETGIEVAFLTDDAPKLIARLESEGAASPADVLITVDVANLTIAKDKGLFAPVDSAVLASNIPAQYRDDENHWFGLSKRIRAIFYNKDAVKPEELSTYEDLAAPKWKGEVLSRTSAHSYTQSLLANIVAVHGAEGAQNWANGVVANFARPPQGGDSDQIKAVAAGEAKLAIANSYYYGRMLEGSLPEEKLVQEKVGIFFPNQQAAEGQLSGAHANISGAGLLATSKHPEHAVKLLEYLSDTHAQEIYAASNKEFPVNPNVTPDAVLAAWGEFREDDTPLATWSAYSKEAIRIADKAGWK